MIASGVLIAYLALEIVLADDGAVEIIYLEIDDERQADLPGTARPPESRTTWS